MAASASGIRLRAASNAFSGQRRTAKSCTAKIGRSANGARVATVVRPRLTPTIAPARSGSPSGPTELIRPATATRSGSRAAQAAAWGPPPEIPATPKRSILR